MPVGHSTGGVELAIRFPTVTPREEIDLYSILQSAVTTETLTLLLDSRPCESKASMCVINIPQIIFNVNTHFFSQKSHSPYIPRKKILPFFFYKKAVIHEMFYEKNYKLRETGKSVNIS